MKRKFAEKLLVFSMVVCLGAGNVVSAQASEVPGGGGPPTPNMKESEDYTGEIINYLDKELWFDTTIYNGFMNAYTIIKGNGDNTFDVDAFINSKLGELTLERIKDELCVLGDSQWGSETVINQWKEKGVIEEIHRQGSTDSSFDPADKENIQDIYLTFMPDYMEKGGSTKYPLVIDYHGGGSLFESIDHGFVHICYDNQFMVACPEVNGTDTAYAEEHLLSLIDELEQKGYPVDRNRVYLAGHSMGGIASIYGSPKNSSAIAAISASGCSGIFGESMGFTVKPTPELYQTANPVPMYLQIGTCDNNQWPFQEDVIAGTNQWLALAGCNTMMSSTENILGVTGDKIYEQKIDGTTYTFADYYDSYGNNMVKLAAVEGLPHWVSYNYSQLSWDFMKQYSRGEDGMLFVEGKPYNGTSSAGGQEQRPTENNQGQQPTENSQEQKPTENNQGQQLTTKTAPKTGERDVALTVCLCIVLAGAYMLVMLQRKKQHR